MLHNEENTLYRAILELKTIEECSSFFHDLCTPSELEAMTDRFRVAQLLSQHKLSYRQIHQKTGVSLATIGRVARFLSQEAYHGYRLVLQRLNRNQTNNASH
jgi:TrpR-related protein YerC/YecD